MTERLRLLAPAKLNWTLEVLCRRPDGYHELRSVLQTIDLADTVTLAPAAGLSLTVTGAAEGVGPAEANLAWRAAALLRERFGIDAGAEIVLHKRIPVAAGLGGGSSDAAAVLRGLTRLWRLDLSADQLIALAAELGSDVPFFLHSGAALAEGRGERVTPLPDAPAWDIALLPGSGGGGKTASLFALLRPADFADGRASAALSAALHAGKASTAMDVERHYVNTFERVADATFPDLAARRRSLVAATGAPAHLAGAGPSLFAALSAETPLPPGVLRVRTLPRDAALAVETLDE